MSFNRAMSELAHDTGRQLYFGLRAFIIGDIILGTIWALNYVFESHIPAWLRYVVLIAIVLDYFVRSWIELFLGEDNNGFIGNVRRALQRSGS